MSDAETVLYEVRDGIAIVKINRPEIRNALSPAAANRLHDLWGEVDADRNVRVAILTSADCGTFCAGLDLREASRVKKEEGVDILTKMKSIMTAMSAGCDAGMALAHNIYRAAYASEDAQEGPRAFAEKRKPVWKGQ